MRPSSVVRVALHGPSRRQWIRPFSLPLVALASAFGFASLHAADDSSSWLRNWLGQENMTGGWDGARARLHDEGFDFWGNYVINLAGNISGGFRQGVTYTDNQAVGVDIDFGKLARWQGTKLHISFDNRDGQSLSNGYIGNIFQVQQIFGGGELARLMELTIEQSLWDNLVNFRAGRAMGGNDFATSPLYGNFMNQAMCGNMGSLGKNISLSFYPVASWGGRVQIRPASWFMIQSGIFEANPTLNMKHGFDWSTAGATGVIYMTELWVMPGTEPGGMLGHYKFGFYYDSSTATDFFRNNAGASAVATGTPFKTYPGKTGAYFLADQIVYRVRDAGNKGLTLLGGVSYANQNTNFMPLYVFGGFLYTGLIPTRDNDTTGFSVSYGRVSSDLARTQRLQGKPPQSSETIMEWNYAVHVAKWFTFQPNVQFVVRPGGTGAIPNAVVLGLQTTMNF